MPMFSSDNHWMSLLGWIGGTIYRTLDPKLTSPSQTKHFWYDPGNGGPGCMQRLRSQNDAGPSCSTASSSKMMRESVIHVHNNGMTSILNVLQIKVPALRWTPNGCLIRNAWHAFIPWKRHSRTDLMNFLASEVARSWICSRALSYLPRRWYV